MPFVGAMQCSSVLSTLIEAAVVINEFLANPDTTFGEEWVELYNTDNTASVDVGNYRVSDNQGISRAKTIPKDDSSVITPHGFFYFSVSTTDRYLNNGGDSLYLYDDNNEVIDSYTFSNFQIGDLSSFRFPDGGEWELELKAATPRKTNNVTLMPIAINEIFPNPGNGNREEWVELYNMHPTAVLNLRGYSISDAAGGIKMVPEDAIIQNNSFYVFTVAASDRYLNNGGDTVTLLFSNGDESRAVIDSHDYLSATVEQSYFRFPDGGQWSPVASMPSKGTTNNVSFDAAPEIGSFKGRDSSCSLLVGSFNIQKFGASKSSKDEVMDVLVDILAEYQLVGIQEVTQQPDDRCGPRTGSAVCELVAKLNALVYTPEVPTRYDLVIGERKPEDSNNKEQYLFLYDHTVLELIEHHNYHDPDERFERDPFLARFRVTGPPSSSLAAAGYDFAVAQLHTPPSE
eukprot:gene3053-3879_t